MRVVGARRLLVPLNHSGFVTSNDASSCAAKLARTVASKPAKRGQAARPGMGIATGALPVRIASASGRIRSQSSGVLARSPPV